MAFDEAAASTVLFGGENGATTLDDTWKWNGTTWARQSPATSPPARARAAMAFDPATGELVLFGGAAGSTYLNDTWTWNGTTWVQQSPAASPPARRGAAMAFDPATGNLVLFGGSAGGVSFGDTWTWSGTTWTQQSPATSPSARAGASTAFDPAKGNMVLFGGGVGSSDLSDTWTWDGTTWTEQSPASSPPARRGAVMDYDSATGSVILSAGQNATSDLADTWAWNGSSWAQVVSSTGPAARTWATMSFDEATGLMVLFGGLSDGAAGSETWTWGLPGQILTGWHKLGPAPSWQKCTRLACRNEVPYAASMTYDSATGNMVLFGGSDQSDTWTWDGTTWTEQSPASPPARDRAAMAFDPATGNVVLFGGETSGGVLNDTWTWNGSNWTQLLPPTSPPAATCGTSSMAFDPATGYLLLVCNGTWSWNGSTWTELSTSDPGGGNPHPQTPVTETSPVAFNPATGNIVLLGTGLVKDTWTWDGTSWIDHGASPPMGQATLAFDPAARSMDAYAVDYSNHPSTWTWNGSSWSPQSTNPIGPSSLALEPMVFDPSTAELAFIDSGGTRFPAVTWVYSAHGTTVPAEPMDLKTIPGDGQVSLSWTPPSSTGGLPLTGYNVFAGTAPSGESTISVNASPLQSTQYTVTGLDNGLRYYFVVKAINADGLSSSSNEASVTLQPRVSSVSPDSGSLSGSQSVTISGSGFTHANAVDFGTTSAAFSVINDSTIDATTPAHAAGRVDVTVATPFSTSAVVPTDRFTFEAAPTLTGVSPDAGPASGSTIVTISGTNLVDPTSVKFGSMPAASFEVLSATKITAVAPAESAGTFDVQVTTPSGTSPATVADKFTFVATPGVKSISPTSGPSTGGTKVTITGSNFSFVQTVTFGTTPASYTVVNSTTITVISPSEGAGLVDVRVKTVGGISSIVASDKYTYT